MPLPCAGIRTAHAWVKLPDSLCPSRRDENESVRLPPRRDGQSRTWRTATRRMPTCTARWTSRPRRRIRRWATRASAAIRSARRHDLPACNSYRLIQSYVAAAAEITDDPTDEIQRKCCMNGHELPEVPGSASTTSASPSRAARPPTAATRQPSAGPGSARSRSLRSTCRRASDRSYRGLSRGSAAAGHKGDQGTLSKRALRA